jgi:hypothetical protein
MSIIISKEGKNAQKHDKTTIAHEGYLQGYICANPESLPLNEIKEDLRLLILAREFPTNNGIVDALGIDQDGNIYVIETKLYKNPDKRRVLAQVLDYGASIWRTYEDSAMFFEELERAVSKIFGITLHKKAQDFYAIDTEMVENILHNIRRNLSDGSFRFVILMDHLGDNLKNLIAFVNRNSRFDIFGVEMEFYNFQEYEILIPKLYGAEVKKEIGVSMSIGSTPSVNKIVELVDREMRMGEIVQRLKDAGMRIDQKTLQRRLKEAVEWKKLSSPRRGFYAPAWIPTFSCLHSVQITH